MYDFENNIYLVEQTNIRNFSKNLIFGKFVGSDEHGNKYYMSKKMSVGLFNKKYRSYKNYLRLVLWIHHTVDKIPNNKDTKYSWQKKHLENQTNFENSFKPVN